MYTVAGIGELLWDVLPNEEKLGGAPINFTYHATALGGTGIPISCVGNDQRGRKALDFLAGKHLETDYITTVDAFPTGTVTITIDPSGVATYQFPDDVAWDHLEVKALHRLLPSRLHAVCFGTLAQRNEPTRSTIQTLLRQLPPGTKKIFDINLRQQFYNRDIIKTSLALCTIVKLNEDELSVLSSLFGLSGTVQEQLRQLRGSFDLELAILTRGDRGSLLLTSCECVEHPGIPSAIVDTIGAGDSFTAAVTIGLLNGVPLPEISDKANRLAAYVCAHTGAMPEIPTHFRYC